MIRITLIAAFILLIAGEAIAEDSKDYARMARSVWSAFECAALASDLGKSKEQERLFQFGYRQGKTFIGAVRSGKVKQKDLQAISPIGVLWRLQGPNADFMLGRIYAAAADNALKDLYGTGGHLSSYETRELLLNNRFSDKNCQLIGSGR